MNRRFLGAAVALPALAAVFLLVPAPASFAAKDRAHPTDLITVAPDFDAFRVKAIAMLPVATFDKNYAAERTVGNFLAQDLRGTGYRWVSAAVTREMLGDSLLKLARDGVLKDVHVDSLLAPVLCAKLRVDAVLAVRVDQWEQMQLLWNQTGRPMTSVQVKAALVDSTGALLWSASGSETGEGPYHDPSTNPIAVQGSSLETTPITGEGGPPTFDEVTNKLLLRWAPQFPRLAVPPNVGK